MKTLVVTQKGEGFDVNLDLFEAQISAFPCNENIDRDMKFYPNIRIIKKYL